MLVAAAHHIVAVADASCGKVEGLDDTEGRIAEMWVYSQGIIHIFAVYVWHSEGWSPRNEALMSAVLRRAADTRSHWIIACDANMDPAEFAAGDDVQESKAEVKAPAQGSASYCGKRAGEDDIRKTFGCFVVSEWLERNCESECGL